MYREILSKPKLEKKYEPKTDYNLLQDFADYFKLPFDVERLQKSFSLQYDVCHKLTKCSKEQYVLDNVMTVYYNQLQHYYETKLDKIDSVLTQYINQRNNDMPKV